MAKTEEPQTIDMTRENLATAEAVEMLGRISAASLKQYGQVTFVMRPDGGVAYANNDFVHIEPQAVPDLVDRPHRLVRPILGDGRPQYVMWKDGILWEVAFDEVEPNSGG